jgi:hypothetical protein
MIKGSDKIDQWISIPHHDHIVQAYDVIYKNGKHLQITDYIEKATSVKSFIEIFNL